jgi:shikimate 5-dehydrogenase
MTSRGQERLARSAELIQAETLTMAEAGRRRWDVLVNATPAGSLRDPDGRAIDAEWAAPGAVVVETNYRPATTPLVREARARGLDVIGGQAVYASQAAAQLRIFLPSAGDLAASVRDATTWALQSNASS